MNLFTPHSLRSKIDVQSASFSVEGPKGQNDDRLLEPVDFNGGWLAAIADGVGGNAGGGRAAEIALETVAQGIATNSPNLFENLFREACDRMASEAREHEEWARMATTLSAVRVTDGTAHVGHVGDSRIYHIRGEGIVTRTQDQTEVAELLRRNVLTPGQAKRYPRRNVILSYLSPNAEFNLSESIFSVEPGDMIILLTDGIYNDIKKSRISDLSAKAGTVEEFVTAIKQIIIAAGPRDDSSLVAIRL